MKRIYIIIGLCFGLIATCEAQKVISSFDELVALTGEKSFTINNLEYKLAQVKKARLVALGDIADLRVGVTGSYTNNIELPVNLFPAEILGGEPGTFQEVQLGVQYVTNFNVYIEASLLNLSGWEKHKQAGINIKSTEIDNKLSVKTLYENTAGVYYNIITLQEQLESTKLNLLAADTLYQNVLRRFETGLVKQQDLNDSKANKLQVEESVKQIEYHIQQQYLALKILCDIPEGDSIIIQHSNQPELNSNTVDVMQNDLEVLQASYRETLTRSEQRNIYYSKLPVVSVFASRTLQQFNTQSTLFDNNVRWIPSSYVGIKFSLPMPRPTNLTQVSMAKIDYEIAKNNTAQARLKAQTGATQLQTDYNKALSQFRNQTEIYALRKDSYQKNLMNYQEGIATIDQTINSFNAMVNSNYQLISAAISVKLAETKININNKIQ